MQNNTSVTYSTYENSSTHIGIDYTGTWTSHSIPDLLVFHCFTVGP